MNLSLVALVKFCILVDLEILGSLGGCTDSQQSIGNCTILIQNSIAMASEP